MTADWIDHARDTERMHAECDRETARALQIAVAMHCRGQMIPDAVARYCRTCAVNLNRDLLRNKGIDPGPIKGRLEDYHDRS